MQIFVNGEPQNAPDSQSIAELLASLELTERRCAVEVNEELVPRTEHAEHRLKEGDQVEIVHAIGGG